MQGEGQVGVLLASGCVTGLSFRAIYILHVTDRYSRAAARNMVSWSWLKQVSARNHALEPTAISSRSINRARSDKIAHFFALHSWFCLPSLALSRFESWIIITIFGSDIFDL